jgi:lipoprotein-releasing system permease protein
MSVAFAIAKRFLTYSKGQTLAIMLGIAIGVSVQIFIGLLITGLQTGLIDKTVGNSAHIIVTQVDDEAFSVSQSGFTTLKEFTSVSYAVDGALVARIGDVSASALLRSADDGALAIYDYENALTDGRLPKANEEVILGSLLAEELGVDVGDSLTLQTFTNATTEVTIVGIFDLSVAAINERWMVGTPQGAQSLFGLGNQITSIEIQVKDVFAADALALTLKDDLRSDYAVVDWKSQNESLLSGLNGQSISSLMIQIFVLISVVLGIASVLAITVLQKSKQIGILKAMGINDTKASLIFLFQGMILGVFGALLGVALGVGLLVSFTTFARNPDGTALIPITFDIPFILFSAGVALVSAMIASLIPANRTRKLSPIEVIRNG